MDFPLLTVPQLEQTLRTARTVAVLGIQPESRRDRDAHQIPLYLARVGYCIVPVPIRYPEVSHILGMPVYRRLTQVPVPIDVLSVFCRPRDFAPHLDDILLVRPSVVWFQSGLLDEDAARRIACAGLAVAEDCIGCRRASMQPSCAPWPQNPKP